MTTGKESYLGDGLYVCICPQGIRLRAPRLGGDHVVYLDDETLDAFMVWLAQIRKTALAEGPPQ
jgi:hypothetical protein